MAGRIFVSTLDPCVIIYLLEYASSSASSSHFVPSIYHCRQLTSHFRIIFPCRICVFFRDAASLRRLVTSTRIWWLEWGVMELGMASGSAMMRPSSAPPRMHASGHGRTLPFSGTSFSAWHVLNTFLLAQGLDYAERDISSHPHSPLHGWA